MDTHLGKSIKLYLADGSPHGILTAEIMNWTGHLVSGPRAKLPELIKRPEMNRTGIYFLIGSDPEITEKPVVYIGESDNVGKRLIQHNKDDSKDFWEKTCVLTSKDQNLTKAHVRYLESRLIAISQDVSRAHIANGTAPASNMFLPEADQADMEYFIAQIRLMLPALGLEFLREKPRVIKPCDQSNKDELQSAQDASPVFIAHSKKHDITAYAQEIDGDFVVLQGSEAMAEWIGAANKSSYKPLYERLFAEGKLLLNPENTKAIFQDNIVFKSPSAALSVVFGSARNGRKFWKVKETSQTYAEWQDAQIEFSTSEEAA